MNEERGAEQDYMADAWGSGRSSHDGSELLDEDMRMSGEESRIDEAALHQSENEDGGPGEADGEADDMMDDRMSSSPSIDDNGGYRFLSSRSALAPPCIGSASPDDVYSSSGRARQAYATDGVLCRLRREHEDDQVKTAAVRAKRVHRIANPLRDSVWHLFEPDRDLGPVANTIVAQRTRSDGSTVTRSFPVSPLDLTWGDATLRKPSSPARSNNPRSRANDNVAKKHPPNPSLVEIDRSANRLHEAEDIDPDFVYALHNFVATVEGQANAAKGDSMVLLDDTNSYWWLVRLVKDSSIGKINNAARYPMTDLTSGRSGYLPAEHIELPVEREARQNKHRNLEVGCKDLGLHALSADAFAVGPYPSTR